MSGIRSVPCVLLLVAAMAAATSASIDLTLSSQIVVKGDDVNVRCRVEDFRIGYLLFWWKKQEANRVQIGANDFVEKVVRDTGRYSVDIEQKHNDVIYVLKITDAQPEDSGEFGCSVAQLEDSDVYRALTVVTPVENVRLFSMSANASSEEPSREFVQGDVVNFQEGGSYYFRCIAYGSNPLPDVVFYSGTKDITDFFEREDDADVVGEIPGMQRIVHTSTLTSSKAVVANWQYSGRDLHCTASVVFTDPVSIYVTPVFRFRPKVMCPAVLLSPAYVEGMRLECRVRANPGLDDIVWSWQRVDGTVMTLKHGQKEGYYSVTVEDGETSDEQVIALVMEKVYPQMFRSYSLLAVSSLGYNNASIILEQRSNDEPQIDGATSLRVTSLLCVLFVLALGLGSVRQL